MGYHRRKKGHANKPAAPAAAEPSQPTPTVADVQTSPPEVEKVPEIVADVKSPAVVEEKKDVPVVVEVRNE